MRYLTLSADRFEPKLNEEGSDQEFDWAEELPRRICDEVRAWNEDYQSVIPMSEAERRASSERVGALDLEGLRLAGDIARALGESKVKYYSEGTYSYLLP